MCEGGSVLPVDILAFSSPCQNLSVAGNGKGLEGKESGLFHEGIRVIKEMRESTNGKYPRYAVWENVYGAFSSSNKKDFRQVLEEFCKVKDPDAYVPQPDKWEHSGIIMGEGYSIAWRGLDAQYWGVPQRRKRVFIVADFNGQSAGEILFECESLRGDSEKSEGEGQGIASDSGKGFEGSNQKTICLMDQGGERMEIEYDKTGTLRAQMGGHVPTVVVDKDSVYSILGNMVGRTIENGPKATGFSKDLAPCLTATDRHAVSYAVESFTFENHANDCRYTGPLEVCQTLSTRLGTGGGNEPLVVDFVTTTPKLLEKLDVYGSSKAYFHTQPTANMSEILTASDYKDPPIVYHPVDDGRISAHEVEEETYTYVVRRMTPTECARLQGFPDDYAKIEGNDNPTDEEVQEWKEIFDHYNEAIGKNVKPKTTNQIKKWLKNPYTDAAEYKLWGNGIAYPCADFIIKNLANYLKNNE